MSQRKPLPDTAALLGALINRFSPTEIVYLSKEEIEDAPDVEMQEMFDTEQVRLRVSTYQEEPTVDEIVLDSVAGIGLPGTKT